MDCPKRSKGAVASDLPEDSLVEILARFPARSLCRSKCVAKAWRDVIEDPFHRKKLPQTLQGFFSITQDVFGLHIGYASLLARSAPLHMDPSLSFLTELPGFQSLTFLDSCNGLLVFGHTEKSVLGYVVCNPTTKQWGVVPSYYGLPPSSMCGTGPMYLVFDPTISSHFHLVQFVWGREEFEYEGFVVDDDYEDGEEGNDGNVHDYQGRRHQQQHYDDDDDDDNEDEDKMCTSLNVYSSESGQWIHTESVWYKHCLEGWHLLSSCAVLNVMLHFIIYARYTADQIAVVDVQGVTRRIIPVPITAAKDHCVQSGYVAQSQGCLYYINIAVDAQLSIWVLQDYNRQEWVLKHSVRLERFGRMSRRQSHRGHKKDYSVVAMHPDANVVFIVLEWNQKLISYDMDHKLVSVIRTLKECTSTTDVLVPYVPCFLESPALTQISSESCILDLSME